METATCGTIRQKLLKVGAVLKLSSSAVAGLHQCRLSISGTLETCGQPHIEVRLWVILF